MAKEKKQESGTTEIVKVVEKKVKNATESVKKMVIKTDEDMASAAAMMTNVKALKKYITQEKEKITKPIEEGLKAVKNMFAPLEFDIKEAITQLDSAMIKYHDKKEAERLKKQESVVEKIEAGEVSEDKGIQKLEKIGEEKKTLRTGTGSVTFTKIRKVRFTDPKEIQTEYLALLVEKGYLVWDEVKARKDALAGVEIVGVEVYEETGSSTRT